MQAHKPCSRCIACLGKTSHSDTEYAGQVWDPHLHKDIDQLERVQKFALRTRTKQWDLGYAGLLNRFKVPSLGDRRNYLSL